MGCELKLHCAAFLSCDRKKRPFDLVEHRPKLLSNYFHFLNIIIFEPHHSVLEIGQVCNEGCTGTAVT